MSDDKQKEIMALSKKLIEAYEVRETRKLGMLRMATKEEHQHFIEVARKTILGIPVEDSEPKTAYKPCAHCGK